MIKVVTIKPEGQYKLFVRLSNGKEGIFDVAPYLDKGIFRELVNESYFKQVRLSFGGITWPNSQDFSADTIEFELQH
jgi:hypothetical protein